MEGFYKYDRSKKSTCLDIVAASHNPDWCIKKWKTEFPEICWQYPKSDALVQGCIEQSKINENERAIFFANVLHCVTPMELIVRPSFAAKINERLKTRLEEFARNRELQSFIDEQFLETVPCIGYVNDQYFRGKIIRVHNKSSIEIENVDEGGRVLLTKDKVKALPMKFGRIPPLIIHCSMKSIGSTGLEANKVFVFQRHIKACNGMVRIQMCSTNEPFKVNVLHPTTIGIDFGDVFFPKAPKTDDELTFYKIDNTSEETEKLCESIDDRIVSFKYFPKMPRRQLEYTVSFIENAQRIFLKSARMTEATDEIESHIRSQWKSFDTIENACDESAVLIRSANGTFHRAWITKLSSIFLIDHGLTIQSYDSCEMKIIRNIKLLSLPPQIHKVALVGRMGYSPHCSETKILKEILSKDAKVYFNCVANQASTEGDLKTEQHNSIRDIVDERLNQDKINPRCTDILPYYMS